MRRAANALRGPQHRDRHSARGPLAARESRRGSHVSPRCRHTKAFGGSRFQRLAGLAQFFISVRDRALAARHVQARLAKTRVPLQSRGRCPRLEKGANSSSKPVLKYVGLGSAKRISTWPGSSLQDHAH